MKSSKAYAIAKYKLYDLKKVDDGTNKDNMSKNFKFITTKSTLVTVLTTNFLWLIILSGNSLIVQWSVLFS